MGFYRNCENKHDRWMDERAAAVVDDRFDRGIDHVMSINKPMGLNRSGVRVDHGYASTHFVSNHNSSVNICVRKMC